MKNKIENLIEMKMFYENKLQKSKLKRVSSWKGNKKKVTNYILNGKAAIIVLSWIDKKDIV